MAYVEDLGSNKHKVYVDLGRDSRGKRRRRTKTITVTSNRDLNKQVRDFELKCLQEQEEPIENITFSGFVDRWRKNYANEKLKSNTMVMYDYVLNNSIIDYFGKMKMKDIKRFHIVEYLNKQETLGPNKHVVIKSIFAQAAKWEVIKDNPTNYVDTPEYKTKKKRDYYKEEEISHLLTVLNDVNPKHRIMVKLAVIGGMRRSEIAGIRIESINYDERYIYVDKQLVYKTGRGLFLDAVKNGKPRKVYFSAKFMKELKSYVTDLKKRKMQMGNAWKPLVLDNKEINLIMVKDDGYPTNPQSISKEWKKIVKRHDLKDITFHQLRHSCASLLVKKGVNFKLIQERLGHSSISITLNVYSHLEADEHKESVEIFDVL